MTTTTQEVKKPYIIHDKIMKVYLVMVDKSGKPVLIAHFLTKEEAENFIS